MSHVSKIGCVNIPGTARYPHAFHGFIPARASSFTMFHPWIFPPTMPLGHCIEPHPCSQEAFPIRNLHRVAARGHPEVVAFLQEKGDDLRVAAGCPVQHQAVQVLVQARAARSRRRPRTAGRSPQRAASMLASRRAEKCSNEDIFSSAPLIFMFYLSPSLLMELLLNELETELIEL